MELKRILGLWILAVYGLGTILGAGIYALIGDVAQIANQYTPLAFAIASLIALFTATSYAELCSRFPYSAGSSLYVRKAFSKSWLSGLIGWMIVVTGIVSAGTLTHAFVNYFQQLLPLSSGIIMLGVVLVLGVIACLGISESAYTIVLMTALEIFGLLLIIFYGREAFVDVDIHQLIPKNLNDWSKCVSASFLAFYAFIGFEDMVNIAEETKNPEKVIPIAIFIALGVATLLYLLVSTITVYLVPVSTLEKSNVPLAYLIESKGHSAMTLIVIALAAIVNGILAQIIMASRLIYGMSKQHNAPRIFSYIHKSSQTPLIATVFIVITILILSYGFPIKTLARATSTVMLVIFCFINAALIKVKWSHHQTANIQVPFIFPVIGLILCILFLANQLYG